MEKIFYFAQVFNSLHYIATVLIVITIAAILITLIKIDCDFSFDEEDLKYFKKTVQYIAITFTIGILGVTFCPTKRTYLFMIGGRVVDELVENNPTIKEIPGNTIDLLNEYIKLETEKIRNKRE